MVVQFLERILVCVCVQVCACINVCVRTYVRVKWSERV